MKPESILRLEKEFGVELKLVEYNEDFFNWKYTNSYQLNEDYEIIGLDLTANAIKNISFLKDFQYLNYLYLNNNEILDIEVLKYLQHLRVLLLSDNQILDLDALKDLHQLNFLDLSYNQISDIDKLKQLHNLNKLDLSNNEITTIDVLKNLEKLSILYLNNNQIYNIESLLNLENLKNVRIENNYEIEKKISKEVLISEWNIKRKYFKENIKNGNIHFKPDCIFKIERELDIEFSLLKKGKDISPYSEIKYQLNKDFKVTGLYLRWKEINDISFLKYLPLLTKLDLENNQILDINILKDLNQLSELNLKDNKITDISALKDLKQLSKLNLINNQISDITDILNIETLKEVKLRGNEKIEIDYPLSVIEAGWEAIKQYSENSEQNVSFKNVKVLLLGNPNIGKSNLLEYFESNKKPFLNDSTHGVRYKMVTLNTVNFHFWDFGGQEYFHATHKLFFSPSALNVVLWGKDIARNSDEIENQFFDLYYWLRTVEQLNNSYYNEKVLVVENKIDLNSPLNKETSVNQSEIKDKFKTLDLSYSSISLLNLTRVDSFKELFFELSNKIISEFNYPAFYEVFWKRIQNYNKDFLTIDEINNRLDKESVVAALKVFHNMGMLLYFHELIPKKVFCKPQVLLDLLYEKVLSKDKKDRLTKKEIEKTIHKNLLDLNIEDVVKLLKHFDLIFEIEEEKETYFIPQYLKSINPYIEDFQEEIFSGCNVKIIGDNYLMSIAMLKVFSKYGTFVSKDSHDYRFWRNGIIIKKDNAILMIKFVRENQTIELYQDIDKKNFILQKEVVDYILDLPEGQNFTKRNLFNHTEQGYENDRRFKVAFNPTRKLLPWYKLKTKEEYDSYLANNYFGDYNWNSDYFSVSVSNDCNYFINWIELNENKEIGRVKVINSKNDTKIEDIINFSNYLNIEKVSKIKKIFISYSHTDSDAMKELSKYLKGLERNGLIDKWTDLQLQSGSEVKKEILDKLDEADIVILLISQNFIASDFIYDIELPLALKKKLKGSGSIIPVLLSDCTISDLELNIEDESNDSLVKIKMGDYYFTPQDENNSLKPIKEWEHKEKAWTKVYEEVKKKLN